MIMRPVGASTKGNTVHRSKEATAAFVRGSVVCISSARLCATSTSEALRLDPFCAPALQLSSNTLTPTRVLIITLETCRESYYFDRLPIAHGYTHIRQRILPKPARRLRYMAQTPGDAALYAIVSAPQPAS